MEVTIKESSLGHVMIAATATGIKAILIGDDPKELQRDLAKRLPDIPIKAAGAELLKDAADIIASIENPAFGKTQMLDPEGTPFQKKVWAALREIPLGETMSYKDVARKIGQPAAVRAVARACASNPIAILVPCHRVLRSDGAISGYRWGVDKKRELLARENAAITKRAA